VHTQLDGHLHAFFGWKRRRRSARTAPTCPTGIELSFDRRRRSARACRQRKVKEATARMSEPETCSTFSEWRHRYRQGTDSSV
jgi:hypothetical protein